MAYPKRNSVNSVVSFPKASQSLTSIAAISVIASYGLIFLLLTNAGTNPNLLIAGTLFCLVFIQSFVLLLAKFLTFFQKETLNLISYLLMVHLGLELASKVPTLSSALSVGYLVFGAAIVLASVHRKSSLLFTTFLLHALINLYLGFIFEQILTATLLLLGCTLILHKSKSNRSLSPFRFYSLFLLLNISLGLFLQQTFSFGFIESFFLSICASYLISPRKGISLFVSTLLLTALTLVFTALNSDMIVGKLAPVGLGILLLTIGYKINREMVLVLGWFVLFAGVMFNVIPYGILPSLMTLTLFLIASLSILLISKKTTQARGAVK